MPEPIDRDKLADKCEQQIEHIHGYWRSNTAEGWAHTAAAVRDLAEAAVILRTQQVPGVNR